MEEKIDIFAIQQKVDFRVMLRDILRQWWMILFFSLSAAMATDIVVNELYVPRYTATTTLYVTSKGVNNTVYTDISTTSTLAEELSYVLSTSVMERKVAKELGMEELDAEVTVEQASGTNMLTITVTADTAVNAFRVISCMIDNYDTVTEYVLADAVIDIIQAPVVPASPSNSVQDRKLMEEAFLAAAVIVILLTAFAS
ncbi:MAG: Wzz/FepE/Etk N-terminal domain-containing protein [Clostridiales bacterium]|nr:Wzz/FepE/Etk N-terminal domain-containing protein [Clostridiales bacterium]